MMSTKNQFLDIFSQDQWKVEPKEGMTVISPSWLYHWVDANNSEQDRISTAFNVTVNSISTTSRQKARSMP